MNDSTSFENCIRYHSARINREKMTVSFDTDDHSSEISPSARGILYESWLIKPSIHTFKTAITGLCIWSSNSCLIQFKRLEKGNNGAIKRLASTRDRENIKERLKKNQSIDSIFFAKNPIRTYHNNLINWQACVVKDLHIKKIYYSLPFFEYMIDMKEILSLMPSTYKNQIEEELSKNHQTLKKEIKDKVHCDIEFIYPNKTHGIETSSESYMWPYKNHKKLRIDIGIEDMGEYKIPLLASKQGCPIPAVLLGVLDHPCPWYEKEYDISAFKKMAYA